MQRSRESNFASNPLYYSQRIRYTQNPSEFPYYDQTPLANRSQFRHQSQFVNSNNYFELQPATRKLSENQYNSTPKKALIQSPYLQKQDIRSLMRSRKYTGDNLQYSQAGTPKGTGFNVSKFIENFKEGKLSNSATSRKSSENEAIQIQPLSSDRKTIKNSNFMEDLVIPNLPQISKITIDIINNWGDPHFTGAKAIEFFTQQGSQIKPVHIFPESIQIQNLIRGNIFTKCDNQFWLFSSSMNTSITFVFEKRFCLSMIRIWNYNKSGYTERGIRNIRISGDGTSIFVGEIKKADGTLTNYADTAQYILFTESQQILRKIILRDQTPNFTFQDLYQISPSQNTTEELPTIYPFQNVYNCHSIIRVDIVLNYGDPGYTSYQKLRFYSNTGSIIKHKVKTNKDKVMENPPQPIQFHILEPVLVQKIVVKNPNNDAALRKIIVTFDTGLSYTINLGSTTNDQTFLFNSSPKYEFDNILLKDTCLQNTLRFGKEVKIVLHKNYGAEYVSFNKLQVFDVYNTPMLSSRQIPYYVSQNMKYLQSSSYSSWRNPSQKDSFSVPFNESNPVEIVLKFESVIIFGAIILWNKKDGNKLQSVKQMQVRIDDKVTYHGYLNKFQQGCKPHTVLLSCKQQVYECFKDQIQERKEKEIVLYNNQGQLFMSSK